MKRLLTAGTFASLLGWLTLMPVANAMDTVAISNIGFVLNTEPVVFAEEVFGDGSATQEVGSSSMRVTLTASENTALSEGASGLIEFHLLGGAQFGGRAVSTTDLAFTEAGNDPADPDSAGDGALIGWEIRATGGGGNVGDTSVTFVVIGTNAGSDANDYVIEAGDVITFTVPALQNLTGLTEDGMNNAVRVQVNTSSAIATQGNNFQTLRPLTDGENNSTITSDNLLTVENRFELVATSSTAAPSISVANRVMLLDGAVDISTLRGERQGIVIATVAINEASAAVGQDGGGTAGDALALTDDDRVTFSVTGDELDGLMAFVDLNSDLRVGESEIIDLATGLSISATSMAAQFLVADPSSTEENPPENVYLIADGDVLLTPSTYTVSFGLDYGLEHFADETPATGSVTTSFANILQDGFAYAVPSCSQNERGRIRITNETASNVNVFVQGVDQTGAELGFPQVNFTVAREGERHMEAYETITLFTRHLERLFGMNEGQYGLGETCPPGSSWAGRAQMTFFADGNITVTPLLRGGDGQLRVLGGTTGLVVESGTDREPITK